MIIFPTRFESVLSAFVLQACVPKGLFLHLFEFWLLGFTAFDKKPVGGLVGVDDVKLHLWKDSRSFQSIFVNCMQ